MNRQKVNYALVSVKTTFKYMYMDYFIKIFTPYINTKFEYTVYHVWSPHFRRL